MRRPRAGDDNGDDRYGVRVDEPRRHLSSPLLLFSPSPSLLPSLSSSSSSPSSPSCFPSSSSSYLLLLPTVGARARRARGWRRAGARAGEPAGQARGEPAAAARWLLRRRRSGYGAAAGQLRRACVCVSGVCVVCVVSGFFYISNLFAECQIRGTRQRNYFAECPRSGTRRNKKLKNKSCPGFAECLGLALGKIFTLPSAKPWHSAK